MTRVALVLRDGNGQKDRSEYRFNNETGDPHVDGRLIVDGETYAIRGDEWVIRADNAGDAMARFVCTLAVEPANE
jgi:hypothetical protein